MKLKNKDICRANIIAPRTESVPVAPAKGYIIGAVNSQAANQLALSLEIFTGSIRALNRFIPGIVFKDL